MKVKNEIKKLKIDFLSFLTGGAKPSNQFEYIMAKSDLESGRKFELESDGENISIIINKALEKSEVETLTAINEELNEYWSKFPPPLVNAIVELVKMAGAVKMEKAEVVGLDQVEALIKTYLGKEEKKGPFDSVPDNFLPPMYQTELAKKRAAELKELIENEEEDEDVKLPKKAVSKQIRGDDVDDDDQDPDELEGMPELSAFLNYHRP